jgi:TolB-like protein/DNA-binding winged helix-turn-helix (wHTH) protein
VGIEVSAHTPAACLLRFDAFELDTRAGELRKRGVKLRLQGQPLQVLAALLQHSGDLVTRDELRAQIWPADTFVDFDHSLHNAIARLREVLGDSAQKPHYIETLPRRGYRFIGQVEGGELEEPEQPASIDESVEAAPVVPSTKGRTALLSVTLLILASIASAFWMVRPGSPRASASENLQLHSLAVLPLDNLSADPSQQYFVDGMTDELITDLAKVSSLRVISRTSVMRYKGTTKTLPEIARELNVDAVIEGSVVRSGKRVRITAQLLHGPTDRHLWAETYERDLGDVLRLQSEVAQAIAQQVRAPLMANMTEFGRSPLLSVRQLAEIGYRIVIFPMTAFRVSMHAAENCLRDLKRRGTQKAWIERMQTRDQLYKLLDYDPRK